MRFVRMYIVKDAVLKEIFKCALKKESLSAWACAAFPLEGGGAHAH